MAWPSRLSISNLTSHNRLLILLSTLSKACFFSIHTSMSNSKICALTSEMEACNLQCGQAELKDKESVHWCLEIAISYFSLVSPSPNIRLIGGRKNVLETQTFEGWGNLIRFFFWGRQALYKHLFLHPSPTYSFFASPISVNLPLKLSSFISLYSLLLQHAS